MNHPAPITTTDDLPDIPARAVRGEWTQALLERVRELWLVDGKSAGEIARTVCTEGMPVTRAALCGKLSRLGWPSPNGSRPGGDHGLKKGPSARHGGGLYRTSHKTGSLPKARPEASNLPEPPLEGFLEPGIIADGGQCHWPEGDFSGDKDWRYCGAPTGQDGQRDVTRQYCSHHEDRRTGRHGFTVGRY